HFNSNSYAESNGKIHIICSKIEHSSILRCLEDIENSYLQNLVEITYIDCTNEGEILASDVEKNIKHNTRIVIVMHANNEVPCINDIKEISKVVHNFNKDIILISDCVQTFG